MGFPVFLKKIGFLTVAEKTAQIKIVAWTEIYLFNSPVNVKKNIKKPNTNCNRNNFHTKMFPMMY